MGLWKELGMETSEGLFSVNWEKGGKSRKQWTREACKAFVAAKKRHLASCELDRVSKGDHVYMHSTQDLAWLIFAYKYAGGYSTSRNRCLSEFQTAVLNAIATFQGDINAPMRDGHTCFTFAFATRKFDYDLARAFRARGDVDIICRGKRGRTFVQQRYYYGPDGLSAAETAFPGIVEATIKADKQRSDEFRGDVYRNVWSMASETRLTLLDAGAASIQLLDGALRAFRSHLSTDEYKWRRHKQAEMQHLKKEFGWFASPRKGWLKATRGGMSILDVKTTRNASKRRSTAITPVRGIEAWLRPPSRLLCTVLADSLRMCIRTRVLDGRPLRERSEYAMLVALFLDPTASRDKWAPTWTITQWDEQYGM